MEEEKQHVKDECQVCEVKVQQQKACWKVEVMIMGPLKTKDRGKGKGKNKMKVVKAEIEIESNQDESA